jgi:hypothetical protein
MAMSVPVMGRGTYTGDTHVQLNEEEEDRVLHALAALSHYPQCAGLQQDATTGRLGKRLRCLCVLSRSCA